GPFIYFFIQKKAEDKLLKEQRQYQTTLSQASLGMGQIKELKRLLNLIVHIVSRSVKVEHCSIYLFHDASNKFILKASKGKGRSGSGTNQVNSFRKEHALVQYLQKAKEPVIHEEIKQKAADYNDNSLVDLCILLDKIDGEMIIPSFIDQKIVAILVLGKKKSGHLYSHDDTVVFSILANQAALSIENAIFCENIEKTQEQLFKAEKMATIGTMADGLSHQINNRLHAMGFIAGDALDTIKLKKKDDMSPETKELLNDIGHALERIEDNVKRGGEIVEGLLRYTRKGEEGFSPVDLNTLIDAALEMAQFKIKLKDMNIIRNFSLDIPKIKGNFTQLQEVFFNMIDNSYDAMMQRKEELEEPEYKPTLFISAQPFGTDQLEIILKDNGIGVKKQDILKLFTPFFTTKLSSKKGTGLGLYVIRQIVEENHQGKVHFSSIYRQGSQTQIVLPIYHQTDAVKS
ncbi:MAG: GAF domain-containing protein, partial [Candidatus Omnitrophica bacterium]|nr:GAF domain-containing protein [Candidatus Omnitrophota bacterium]